MWVARKVKTVRLRSALARRAATRRVHLFEEGGEHMDAGGWRAELVVVRRDTDGYMAGEALALESTSLNVLSKESSSSEEEEEAMAS